MSSLTIERGLSETPIEMSRRQLQPTLDMVFAAFGEQYAHIVQQSPTALLVPKKIEYPASFPTGYPQVSETRYAYMMNVVNRQYPNKMDYYEAAFRTFDQAGTITGREWDPNVALQFQVNLTEVYDQKRRKYTGNLEPIIRLFAWGTKPADRQLPVPQGVYISESDGGWNKPMTQVLIYGSDINHSPKSPQALRADVETGMILLRPNILTSLQGR